MKRTLIDIHDELVHILHNKHDRNVLIAKFQEKIWNEIEINSDSEIWEMLSELAYDFDYLEQDRELRKEEPSFYGSEKLEKHICESLKKIQTYLLQNKIRKLSFPDQKIISVEFNPAEKYLLIELDGAWLDGKQLGEGKLVFQKWKDITFRKFDHTCENWIEIEENDFESLVDICEFECNENQAVLRGFGALSDLWIEYKINHSIIKAEFAD